MDYLLAWFNTWFDAATSSAVVAMWLLLACLLSLVVYEYAQRNKNSSALRKQELTRQRVIHSEIEDRVRTVLEPAVMAGHLLRSDVDDFYNKNKFDVPVVEPTEQPRRFPNLNAAGRWLLNKFTFQTKEGAQPLEKKERISGLIVRKS